MRRIAVLAVLAALAAVLPATAAGQDRAAEQAASVVPGSYIVVFHDAVGDVDTATAARERRMGFVARFRYAHALKGFAARLNDRQLAELRADPDVASITENRTVQASAETVPSGIQRIGAYDDGTANGAGSAVAVIDTGVDLDHPDLNVSGTGTNCVGGASPDDDNGHGSHVAGTIGARAGNGAGVVGVAPGTLIHPVKVLNRNGSGSWDQIVCGIDWVTARASTIKVANMSLGGLGSSTDNRACGNSTTALHQAICNSTAAGVRYAVAAGNSAWEYPHATLPDVPAAYREVVAVAAMSDSDGLPGALGPNPSCRTGERDDRVASFSNYSDNSTDNAHTIAAPGVCIASAWKDGGYSTISGTSMASPHVAGAIALCVAGGGCPTSPSQLVSRLDSTDPAHGYVGDPSNGRIDPFYGWMTVIGTLGSGGGSTPPPATGDFSLSASPTSLSIPRRQTRQSTVTLTGDLGSSVSLSVSGATKGVSASLSPTSVPGTGGSSTLTVKAGNKTTTLNLTVTGTGGGLTRSTTVAVTVT